MCAIMKSRVSPPWIRQGCKGPSTPPCIRPSSDPYEINFNWFPWALIPLINPFRRRTRMEIRVLLHNYVLLCFHNYISILKKKSITPQIPIGSLKNFSQFGLAIWPAISWHINIYIYIYERGAFYIDWMVEIKKLYTWTFISILLILISFRFFLFSTADHWFHGSHWSVN